MDTQVHKRFLEYRDRYGYFAKGEGEGARTPSFSYEQFAKMDAEQRALEARADERDDEEEARFQQLTKLLFRD
jgi:hypothetical protein